MTTMPVTNTKDLITSVNFNQSKATKCDDIPKVPGDTSCFQHAGMPIGPDCTLAEIVSQNNPTGSATANKYST